MKRQRFSKLNSAYGQLVLLVFLPISILAGVGAVLVFFETTRAIKSEQDVLAQAALIRYESIVKPLLPSLKKEDYLMLQQRINEMGVNGMTDALHPSESALNLGRRYIADQMYRMQSEQHVRRVAILDSQGEAVVAVGYGKEMAWGEFDRTSDSVWRLPTQVGTAYGMPIYVTINGTQKKFWLMVDMDDNPLTISYYRIVVSLVVTGLTTILLLLLVLSLYSKRWIAPIYELRLFLQKTDVQTLGKTFVVRSDGEFYLLQKDLNATHRRLAEQFFELKRHSEETEADLQQAFDEMEMKNISLGKARDMAIQASATKSAFLANVSHELRTPLNAIDGFINLLSRSDNLDSKQTLYVQTIKKSSAHLLALISDVLDFSKIEAGKLALDNQEFDLSQVIYEVADMLSPTAFDKGLRMAVQIYEDTPKKITGDRMRVKQILTNLVGNAIKFTDTGGVVVKVMLDDEDGFVKISIIDTGRGVDKEVQNQLFTSFGQGDLSVTRRYGGTGLGLVISKQLTQMMGGHIGFFDNSRQGTDKQGATFWFCLPYLDVEPILQEVTLPTLSVLAWISHIPTKETLTMGLMTHTVKLTQVGSLAQLLEVLTKTTAQNGFDVVIADSFGQQGDVTALLRQIRLHYGGRLFVFGYEIGLDETVLESYGATALHEPLNLKKLHGLLSSQPLSAPMLSTWQGKRALIVDDHAPNLLVLEALLGELGVQVIKADSGFVAIEVMSRFYEHYEQTKCLDECIDIIFMDISMPMMSGIAASNAIRKLENTHDTPMVPIVALSAHGLWDDMDELYKAGINSYATKPIAYVELVNLLQKWLGVGKVPPKGKEVTTNPSAQQVVDWQDALSRSQDKPKIAFELLMMMQKSVKDEKIALRAVWSQRDLEGLMQTVHRIVGATRYTGVPHLRQAAESLYQSCTHAQKIHKEQGEVVDFSKLKRDFADLMTALDYLQAVDLTQFCKDCL